MDSEGRRMMADFLCFAFGCVCLYIVVNHNAGRVS